MIQKELVRKLAQERIDERFPDVFIVDITISTKSVIKIELDKKEGYIAIDDCMWISRNVEHNLDREEEDFELSVSSAGLDKPLRVLAQFEKNYGKGVDVTMKDGVKHTGILIAKTDKNLTLETTRTEKLEGAKKKETIVEQLVLSNSKIKDTKIVISFK
jgi:ribosome maturation factor RimP